MKILVADDELSSRIQMAKILSMFGEVTVAHDGTDVITKFLLAHNDKAPYDLICLDIMMPKQDGLAALEEIRSLEANLKIDFNHQVKVIMTTSLSDSSNVFKAFRLQCEGYLIKPILREKVIELLKQFGFVQ